MASFELGEEEVAIDSEFEDTNEDVADKDCEADPEVGAENVKSSVLDEPLDDNDGELVALVEDKLAFDGCPASSRRTTSSRGRKPDTAPSRPASSKTKSVLRYVQTVTTYV